MAIETSPRSRRAILAAGLGGLAATVAAALGRNPTAARAANGDPLLVGTASNTATADTQLNQTTPDIHGFRVLTAGTGTGSFGFSPAGVGVSGMSTSSTGVTGQTSATQRSGVLGQGSANGTGVTGFSGAAAPTTTPTKTGVYGQADQDATARGAYGKSGPGTGVQGESTSGKGIYGKSTSSTGARGQSDSGIGVWGTSLTNRAVFGTTGSTTLPAIGGQNTGGKVGVHGYAGPGTPPAPTAETGVEGVSNISAQANGVYGHSTVGAGVWGATGGGLGVIGTADGDVDGNGVGVYAFGPIGLYAEGPGGGLAAQFAGPTFFTESGKVTISSGSSIVVPIPNGLRPSSLVLAVLHSNRGGIWVRAVVPNVAAGTATIYLNTSVPSATFIAWFVVN